MFTFACMKRSIILLLLVLGYGIAKAGELLLEGTIGTYPIVINLNIDNSSTWGSYFYKSTCSDIVLEGQNSGDNVTLKVSRTNNKTKETEVAETFRLKQGANKSWTGTWTDKKGKQLKVSLSPVNINTIKNPFGYLPEVADLKMKMPYEYMRTACIKIVYDGATVKNGKYTLKYYHLKNTKVKLFEVVNGLEKNVADKVKSVLLSKFMSMASSYYSCATANGIGSGYDMGIGEIFMTDNILSLQLNFDVYCAGNAHPEAGLDILNIDMRTGRQLTLQDVLFLVPGPVPDRESDAWLNYNSEKYAPKLTALLKKLHPEEMVAGGDCDYAEVSAWQYPDWYVSAKGLHILPGFAHAMAPCRETDWAFIPFSVLKLYRNPKVNIVLP